MATSEFLMFAFKFLKKFLVLKLQPLNHLLTEMTSLRQFFFDFFVDGDVSVEVVDFDLHFVVVGEELLSVLGLVLEFICQLGVLVDC